MAVQIGLLLAGISFIKRMSDALDVEEVIPVMTKRNGLTSSEEYDTTCPQLSFYTIDGPLFFGAADRFESTITRSINKRPKVLILKIKNVPMLDATGAANLESLITDFHNMGGTTLISEANKDVLDMLKITGLYEKVGHEHIFTRSEDAVDYGLSLISVEKCTVCSRAGRTSCQSFKTSEELEESS